MHRLEQTLLYVLIAIVFLNVFWDNSSLIWVRYGRLCSIWSKLPRLKETPRYPGRPECARECAAALVPDTGNFIFGKCGAVPAWIFIVVVSPL